LLPPAPDSLAETHRLLHRLESVEADAYLNLWHSLAATGARIEIVDDGDWCGSACPAIPSSAFNRTLGYRLLPNLRERMLDVYRRARTPGWIVGDATIPPWPGAMPMEGGSDVFHAALAEFVAPPVVDGVTVRAIGPDEVAGWADVIVAGFGIEEPEAGAWRDLAPYLIRAPGEHFVLAERDGRPVGAAALFARRKVGLMAAATVLPEERGRGIQAAMVGERVRIATAAGCEWLMATAASEGPSARNLEGLGFNRAWRRSLWRFDPSIG
jgi:GNAT superfamily N-acetyltransferase